MIIGTDISLKECKAEGYLMMDFKKRELIKKGVLIPTVNVTFFAYIPSYVQERYFGEPIERSTDSFLNANDIWELYIEKKIDIDKFIGMEHEFPTCERSLLSVADSVNSYCGL